MIKQRLYLKKGWNLISFNLHDIEMKNIIKNKKIIEIKNLHQVYNSNVSEKFNTLKEFKSDEGYFLKAKEDFILDNIDAHSYFHQVCKDLGKFWHISWWVIVMNNPANKYKRRGMEDLQEALDRMVVIFDF